MANSICSPAAWLEPKKTGHAPASFKGLAQRSGQTQSLDPQRTGCPQGTHLHPARTTRGMLALGVVLPQRGDPDGHRIGLVLGPQKVTHGLVPARKLRS